MAKLDRLKLEGNEETKVKISILLKESKKTDMIGSFCYLARINYRNI
jgi:hypothetical protein